MRCRKWSRKSPQPNATCTCCLAHASPDEARALVKEAPLFDLVVVAGQTNVPSSELELLPGSKTRLMQTGIKAMYAGVVGVFDDPKHPLRFESVPLDAKLEDSPEMLKLLADYQEQLKDLGLEGLGLTPQPHPTGRQFVGSEKCGECHTKAFEIWSNTPHAHATDSLVKPPNSRGDIARHFDPECLSCHVTGWDPQQFHPFESGYLSLEQTPLLKHNGCENCHGPGSAHVAAEQSVCGRSRQNRGTGRHAAAPRRRRCRAQVPRMPRRRQQPRFSPRRSVSEVLEGSRACGQGLDVNVAAHGRIRHPRAI